MKRRILLTALLGAALLLFSQVAPAQAAKRTSAHVQTGTVTAGAPLRTMGITSAGLTVSDMGFNTAQQLVELLVGQNSIAISNVRYTGSPLAAGTFTGGTGIIGFEGGIILSTGAIQNVVGPNVYADKTAKNGTPGDISLGPGTTDAAVLEFDFVPNSDAISFQYVFASEEYNEWANSDFNDVFAFFVNGVNRAYVPGTTSAVSVNTINGGYPVGVNPQHPEYYINNEIPNNTLNTEMDGLTTVLTLQSAVVPGQLNHLKLAIADVGDDQWDSNVFIKAGSFTAGGGTGAPPVTTAQTSPPPNAAGWNNTDVSVMLHAVPTVPGDTVKEVHYQVDGNPEVVVPGDTAGPLFTGEGILTVKYFAVDAYNIVEDPKTLTIKIDTIGPVITGVAYREPNAIGWYNADVPVGFECSDSLSGIASCVGYTTVGEGVNQTVTGTATDKAGNVSTAAVTGINVDKTSPEITGATDRPANQDGWYNAPVTVTFTCSDPLSGVVSCSPPATLSAEGAGQSATGTALDRVGFTASATVSGINIDRTPPLTVANAPALWPVNRTIDVFTATDSLSGVKATYYTVDGGAPQLGPGVTMATGGTHTIQYWSVDKAGNAEPAHTMTVQVDGTAPAISHVQTPAPNADGWNNTDVTVTFTCSDENGIASCTRPVTLTTEGLNQVVTGTATDKAGNTATDQAVVSIDKTAPAVAYSGAKLTYGVADPIDIACTASDTLSGLASSDCQPISYPANTLAPGTYTFSATATDHAGNTGTATVTFTVLSGSGEDPCALIDQWVPQHGVANSLCVKIRNSMAAKERGSYGAAFNLLEAFKQEVEAQADKQILPGGREVLLAFANQLEADLPPVPPDDRDNDDKHK